MRWFNVMVFACLAASGFAVISGAALVPVTIFFGWFVVGTAVSWPLLFLYGALGSCISLVVSLVSSHRDDEWIDVIERQARQKPPKPPQ